MQRTVLRLLAQPLAAAVVYSGSAAMAVVLGVVPTIGRALVLYPILTAVTYLIATHLLPLPKPDRAVSLLWHFDDGDGPFMNLDDALWRNEAKLAPAILVPTATVFPFLMLPTTTYEGIGMPLALLLLLGLATCESWGIYRLSAQYLPRYGPHLFEDEHRPPVSDEPWSRVAEPTRTRS